MPNPTEHANDRRCKSLCSSVGRKRCLKSSISICFLQTIAVLQVLSVFCGPETAALFSPKTQNKACFRFIFTEGAAMLSEDGSKFSQDFHACDDTSSIGKESNVENYCLHLRSGSDEDESLIIAESVISRFLSTSQNIQNGDENKFHIQGWRWHTLSLVRDASRLEKLAIRMLSNTSPSDFDSATEAHPLEKAIHHVIDFNMKGLQRVENDLFFPWLRKKLCEDDDDDVQGAFRKIMDRIDQDRKVADKLALAVKEQAKIASLKTFDQSKRLQAASNLVHMSSALSSRVGSILEREDRFLVPAVAKLVPAKEQISFNNKVLRNLGLLDSRLHLVGMHDAVWESGNLKERELFQKAIPAIPRMMIPRWRRNLYEPQAGVLDEI